MSTSHRFPRLATLAAAACATLALGAGPAAAAPVSGPAPVPSLELSRYLGTWYQLAAVPLPFNLECARETRATYALDPQGNVSVYNQCVTWTGGANDIRGTAKVNDPVTNAQLHVSFPGVPTQDTLDGPTNYIVTALGPDYSWAVVTDPTRVSGFVLSRTPALDAEQWTAVRSAIDAAGQNQCLYLTSPVAGGLSSIAPLCTV